MPTNNSLLESNTDLLAINENRYQGISPVNVDNVNDTISIDDNSITSDKIKSGETLPVNITGNASTADTATDYASDGGIADALAGKLDTNGNASDTTSTFTKASGDTSDMASGGKLSAIFTAISNFFASLKALAFKDKASYDDLSSGVQSSLDKADTAAQPNGSYPNMTVGNATTASDYNTSTGTIKTALAAKTDCVLPASAYGYSLLFTANFNNTNDRKGTISFRVHASLNMQGPLVIVGRIGANSAGYGTMYYTASSNNEDRYKLCYKTVGDNTEVWLIDKFTGGPSERRTRVEFIEIQGAVIVGNNSSSTLPSGLIDFAPAYLKNIKLNGPVGTFRQPVYVTSDGTITKTITGINTFNTTQSNYYELANMTFTGGDYCAAGIQVAISWRDVGNYSGSGILAISFSDYQTTGITGRALISSIRTVADQNFANRFYFYVERISDLNFKLCAKIPANSLLSFSLISGSPNTFTVPSTLTTHSGNATQKLPWNTLTTTAITPA